MFFKQRGGTVSDLMRSYNPSLVNSHPNWKVDLMQRSPDGIPLTDFFGSDVKVSPIYSTYSLSSRKEEENEENTLEQSEIVEPIKSEVSFEFSLEKEFYILFSISFLFIILGLKIKI
jgi:glycosylphosphatidylinositol transamidase (GPIT) subunit GPI8